MDITDIAARRFTSKVYDANRQLTEDQQQALFSLLKNSPSSLNLQPWHFHAITSQAGKEQIASAIYDLNSRKVADAPLVLVFSSLNQLTDEHISAVLEQEMLDGRYADAASRDKADQGRRGYLANYAGDSQQQRAWMDRQAYIALGFLLLGAPAMGLQATPIEGFNAERMDQVLGLQQQGLHSVVVATVGYNNDQDFNAKLPKSRLILDKLFTRL